MEYQLIIDDYIGGWGYSKHFVRRELAKYKGKHVDMRISSLGGELYHAFDIRQQLIDHGDVTVYLSGMVASSATIIAMGAKKVCMMRQGSAFLVHKCSNVIDIWDSCNADEIQSIIDDLTKNKRENDKIDLVIANIYAKKCRKKVDEIMTVLKAGEWMSPEEAKSMGFVDELVDMDVADKKTNLSPDVMRKLNAFGIPTSGLSDILNGVNAHSDSGVSDVSGVSGETDETSETDKTGETGEISDKWQSKLVRVMTFVRSLMGGDVHDVESDVHNVEDVHDVTDVEESITTINMKITDYANVAAAVALDALDGAEDGSVTFNKAQLTALNSKIKSLEDSVTAKDTEIARLNDQVENLMDQPGDDTVDALDDTDKADISEDDMYDLAKKYL